MRCTKRTLTRVSISVLVGLLAAILIVPRIYWPNEIAPDSPDETPLRVPPNASQSLTVMTLNVAHGRRDAFHQMFVAKDAIESNLDDIATVVRENAPDVFAIQEVDGPSLWSGNFNQVEHLAKATTQSHFFRGEHVGDMGLSYGTAIISSCPLGRCESVKFPKNNLTPSKGFVVTRMTWPGDADFTFDVVSVHLDFARATIRKQQTDVMAVKLIERMRPLIVMGDFNCQWIGEESTLRDFADSLKLSAHSPNESMATFPATGDRLDWILVSPEFQITSQRMLDNNLSDHRALVAKIVRRRVRSDRHVRRLGIEND